MYLNRVFKFESKLFRIIYEGIDHYWLMQLKDNNAWPEFISQVDFDDYYENEEIEFISEPYNTPSVLSESTIQKRDEAYQAISPLIEQVPGIFNKSARNKLLSETANNGEHPRIYYVRQLRKYFQQGMTPNALLANYHNSGARGKLRRSGGKKVGRKIKDGSQGIPVTDEICRLFELAIEGHYFTKKEMTLAKTYVKFYGMFLSNYPKIPKKQAPTKHQFYYFYYKNYSKSQVIKVRTPQKIYDNDIRPINSTSTNLNIGPGGRYEIDATIVDIYLVSELDPDLIVGRPTLYLVKDVFSRMVVGMYVGFESASWVTATMAMRNAFCDKVEFCKEFGVDINSADWPSVGIPAGMMADKGELLGNQADALVNALNIQLSNSRSYMGSDKGGVERSFNTIQTSFKPYADGIVEPVNGKKRLGHRYELDANLNLKQFTRMIIRIILHRNNALEVEGYDFARDMPMDLPSVPIQLWNWGIKNRTGRLRFKEENYIKLNLLPQSKATVSDKGIKFRGIFYTSADAVKAGWFDRTGETGRPASVIVSFDPRCVDEIYMRFKGDYENYWVCKLADRSRRFRSLSFPEVSFLNSIKSKVSKQVEQDALDTELELQNELEAQQKKVKQNKPKQSNSQRLKGIKSNKKEEKKLERARTVETLSEKVSGEAKSQAEVIEFKTGKKKKKYKLPSIEDLLGDDD
ncbi:Mu transposase C-terminal domain-containing protein [Catenovulum sediminis]|uniref:Mu transposase C-terminal domain-containing protein n=1 Tax=Catenovulum sediminis TaxID=1740262 RepID=A0ABV1RI68_9ALTE